MLDAKTAKAIVDVVIRDPECQSRIQSRLRFPMPDSWGITGSIRNFGMALVGMDSSESKVERLVCTGIASASARAIDAAAKAGKLAGVAGSSPVDRFKPVAHTATEVMLKDKSTFVFDWHATLNLQNPMMYRSTLEWKRGRSGEVLESFRGWE